MIQLLYSASIKIGSDKAVLIGCQNNAKNNSTLLTLIYIFLKFALRKKQFNLF